jgi:hypothetical protein
MASAPFNRHRCRYDRAVRPLKPARFFVQKSEAISIITRGASLHESLRELIAQFARKNGINAKGALLRYYSPTARQLKIIDHAVKMKKSFEDGWAHAFVSDKFGEATTHWRKLEDRVHRGVGNPCPLLLVGIPKQVVVV